MSIPYDEEEILNLVEKALNVDTDKASGIWLGRDIANAEGAVFVIKGNLEARYVHEMLIKQKLLTPGKPIDGEVGE